MQQQAFGEGKGRHGSAGIEAKGAARRSECETGAMAGGKAGPTGGEGDGGAVRLLCVFRMRYLDFRLAEVQALVAIATGMACRLPLGAGAANGSGPGTSTSGGDADGAACFQLEYLIIDAMC